MGNLTNAADYQQTRGRIGQLKQDTNALWGKMTAGEMVCHIADPMRDLLGVRHTKPLVPALFRPLFKMMLLSKKPFGKNLPTMKPYMQGGKGTGTKPTDFDHDKAILLTLIDQFHATDPKYIFYPHPGAGKLTREENGFLMWKHMDHHLRQFGV